MGFSFRNSNNFFGLYPLGDSDVASTVINESEAEGEEANNFLEDVRATFPQVNKCESLALLSFSFPLLIKHIGCVCIYC